MMNFKNKNYIITGSTEGLGKLISIELSKLGANLILISRSEKKIKKVLNKCKNIHKHKICLIDLNDIEDIKNSLNKVLINNNQIDGVLHIAGGGLGVKSYAPKHKEYIRVFNLNLFSIFEINSTVIPLMKKNKKGVLLHVGSIASNESVGSLSYNVAKSSLSSYVRSLSKQISKYNICPTGISPGGFIFENNAMGRLKKNNKLIYDKFIKERLPRKKMPKAEELLPIIFMLLENNMMFSGNMISCDSAEGNFYKPYY